MELTFRRFRPRTEQQIADAKERRTLRSVLRRLGIHKYTTVFIDEIDDNAGRKIDKILEMAVENDLIVKKRYPGPYSCTAELELTELRITRIDGLAKKLPTYALRELIAALQIIDEPKLKERVIRDLRNDLETFNMALFPVSVLSFSVGLIILDIQNMFSLPSLGGLALILTGIAALGKVIFTELEIDRLNESLGERP